MYHPVRDDRFEYAAEAAAHIEAYNCILGCRFAINPTDEFPGGNCPILDGILLEEDQPDIDDRGYDGLFCTKRQPPIDTTGYIDQPSLLDLLLDPSLDNDR